MSKIWSLVAQTVKEWMDDKVPQQGAALSFYTALSIAPLLVIALGIAALFFGNAAAEEELEHQMRSLIGHEGSKALQEMVTNAYKPSTGVLATVLSSVTLLFAASGVFGQLQDSLNTIWGVPSKSGHSFVQILRGRFLSFAMVLGIGFLLMVSLVVSAGVAAFSAALGNFPDAWAWLAHVINFLVSLASTTILFAMMFKLLPDVRIAWRDVWIGAGVAAILFTVGKLAIGLYLGHSTFASSYGVAGSFVVLLVWVYYSSQILFLGAEFTQVFANRYGSGLVPTEQRVGVGAGPGVKTR